MRRLFRLLALLLLAVVVFVALFLAWNHYQLRGLRPLLPTQSTLGAAGSLGSAGELPVRIRAIESASQTMPRGQVLAAGEAEADAPFEMSHVSFVIGWADGRLFVVDAGMEPEAAIAFGQPVKLLAGGSTVETTASLADQLGAATARVSGIGFTHLHADHVQGIGALCRARRETLPLYRGRLQHEKTNFTTDPGKTLLDEAGCTDAQVIGDAGLLPVPGHPGLALVPVAGHTPGSQVFVVDVQKAGGAPHRYWISGDVANAKDGILEDIGKPWAYRTFLVPEDEERLGEVRRWLRELASKPDSTLFVPHDRASHTAIR